MSTKTIQEPELVVRPSDDGRGTKTRKRVAMAVLGLTALGAVVLAAGANSTRTAPAPVTARSEPAVSPGLPQTPQVPGGCLAEMECYGESQLIPNSPAPQRPAVEDLFAWCMRGVDCPPMADRQAPDSDQNGPSYTAHD